MAIDKVRLKALLSDLKRLTNELESEIYSDNHRQVDPSYLSHSCGITLNVSDFA